MSYILSSTYSYTFEGNIEDNARHNDQVNKYCGATLNVKNIGRLERKDTACCRKAFIIFRSCSKPFTFRRVTPLCYSCIILGSQLNHIHQK